MIENNRLQVFIQAAETLNFSKAAKRLNLSQPTVSHHIRTLEADMDIKLFHREGPNLKLTETGRFLLPLARQQVRNAANFEELVASVNEEVIGHLRIACSTTAGKYVLPRLSARFRQHYPGVRISILRCTQENMAPRLLEGEANLGVVSYEAVSKGIEIQEFFEDHITLIVPETHPWALLESITPDDLIEEPLIIREDQSGTRRVMLTELAKHDIRLDDLTIFLELGNAEAIVDTVAAGHGVSFVSRLATVCMLENREVVEIPVEGIQLSRKIYMARREMDTPNRPQDVFWSFIHNPDNLDLLQMA